MNSQDEIRLENALRDAAPRLEAASSADLAAKVRARFRRRRKRRLATGLATAFLVLAGVGIISRYGGLSRNPEGDRGMPGIARTNAGEGNAAPRQPSSPDSPLPEKLLLALEYERTAALIQFHAEMCLERNEKENSLVEYRRIIEYFPETLTAAKAKTQIAKLTGNQGD